MSASVQVLGGKSAAQTPVSSQVEGAGGWARATSDWGRVQAERNVEMPGDSHSMHVGRGWMPCSSHSANGH